jgi:hypothetical protein
MEALLGLGEVANPQQLKGPVLHRVRTDRLNRGHQGTEHKWRERLQANGLDAAPLALPLVARLEEGDRHGIALLAGAGQPANALDNLKGGAGAKGAGVQPQALTTSDSH